MSLPKERRELAGHRVADEDVMAETFTHFGVDAVFGSASRHGELAGAPARALAHDGPGLVEVTTDAERS